MLETKCKRCGKNFWIAPYHIYRDEKGMYCTWTCYNHRNDDKTKAQTHPKSIPVMQLDRYSGFVIATFNSITEAADHIGGEAKTISRACTANKPYKGYLWRYKNDVS